MNACLHVRRSLLLTELALDRQQEVQFEGIFKLANDSSPHRFTHKQNAQLKLIKNRSHFYCRGHDDNGEPIHAEDCNCQESCLLVKGKKQENHVTKDGQKDKMPSAKMGSAKKIEKMKYFLPILDVVAKILFIINSKHRESL